MSGFEGSSVETLMAIRGNLLKGLEGIGQELAAGTFEVSKKAGSAPPSEAGWLTVALLLGVEDELEGQVRGYERILSLDLVKTL